MNLYEFFWWFSFWAGDAVCVAFRLGCKQEEGKVVVSAAIVPWVGMVLILLGLVTYSWEFPSWFWMIGNVDCK